MCIIFPIMVRNACEDPVSESISFVGRMISKGEWALADFQRDHVWDWSKDSLLFKSIFQGVPLGSIYTWKSPQPELSRGVNELDGLVDYSNPSELIIDGQQRTTALGRLWYSVDNDDAGYHIVAVNVKDAANSPDGAKLFSKKQKLDDIDIEEGEIHLQDLLRDDGLLRVKAKIKTASWFDATIHPDVVDYIKVNFTTRRISIQKLKNHVQRPQALDIFARVNKAGTALSDIDLIEAILVMVYPDLYSKIRSICPTLISVDRGFNKDGTRDIKNSFQHFDRRILLKSILFQINGSTAKSDNINIYNPTDKDGKKLTSKVIENAYNATVDAIKRLKKYVLDRLHFSEYSGGKMTLFPILIATQFLIKNKSPSESDINKMLAWICIANIGPPVSKFLWSGASTNDWADQDCKTASERTNCWDLLLERVQKRKERPVGIKHVKDVLLKEEHFGDLGIAPKVDGGIIYQLSRTLLLRKYSQDLITGHLLHTEDINQLDRHHIFPSSKFKPTGVKSFFAKLGKEPEKCNENELQKCLEENKIQFNKQWKKKKLIDTVKKHHNAWWEDVGENADALKGHFANLCWLRPDSNRNRIKDKWPSNYLKFVPKDRMEAQGIPSNRKLWEKENYQKFIQERTENLVSEMNRAILELWNNKVPNMPATKSSKEILEEFLNGTETTRIEVKSSYTHCTTNNKQDKNLRHQVARAIFAMMNSGGGNVIVGVSDDKKILGLKEDESYTNNDWEKMVNGNNSSMRSFLGKKHQNYWTGGCVEMHKFVYDKKTLVHYEITGSPEFVIHKNYPTKNSKGQVEKSNKIWVRDGPQSIEYKE